MASRLAEVMLRARRFDKALEHFDRALQGRPPPEPARRAQWLRGRAQCRQALGNQAGAEVLKRKGGRKNEKEKKIQGGRRGGGNG